MVVLELLAFSTCQVAGPVPVLGETATLFHNGGLAWIRTTISLIRRDSTVELPDRVNADGRIRTSDLTRWHTLSQLSYIRAMRMIGFEPMALCASVCSATELHPQVVPPSGIEPEPPALQAGAQTI